MVSLSLELMPGSKGSKPPATNVLLLCLICSIFLLHPEGFFWTAVDLIVQVLLMGARIFSRIPILFRENKVVAVLLMLWILALLALQKFRNARTTPLQSRSSHSRKSKRKRPAKRLSSGSIHDGSRQGARTSTSNNPVETHPLDQARGEVDEDEDDEHHDSVRRRNGVLPARLPPSYEVDKDEGKVGGTLSTDERVRQASLETASVSSSDGSVGGSSRSERTPPPPPPPRSSKAQAGEMKGQPAMDKRVGEPGGSWKQATVPSHPGMLSPGNSRREYQSSRSARPNKPFVDYHHNAPSPHPPPSHKKRLGPLSVPRSSPSSPSFVPAPLSPPIVKGNSSNHTTRYVPAVRPSPRGGQNFYAAVTASLPPSTPSNKLPMSPHTPSSQPSRSPCFQASPQPFTYSPAPMPSWHQTQSANEERRGTNTTAWGATNEQPSPKMTTAIPPHPGFSTPVAKRAPRQPVPVSSPPGLLSVKAEPFQPSGRVIQPTTPRLVPASVPSTPQSNVWKLLSAPAPAAA